MLLGYCMFQSKLEVMWLFEFTFVGTLKRPVLMGKLKNETIEITKLARCAIARPRGINNQKQALAT